MPATFDPLLGKLRKKDFTEADIRAIVENATEESVESDDVSSVPGMDIAIQAVTPVIDKTADTAASFALDANKMYMFGERTSLTITLNAGATGIVNEYMFQFTSGSTATTLSIPSSAIWKTSPIILANKKYLVSIENNLAIIGEWNNV